MNRATFLIACVVLTLLGCQSHMRTVRIDAMSIPDQTYEVTVHETAPLYYAVLFDIPDDGMGVALDYTYATLRIGPDTPEKYVDRFATRIKGYRTLQINDRDGTVRGYIIISNLLGYLIYERPPGERLIVSIGDPNLTSGGFIWTP